MEKLYKSHAMGMSFPKRAREGFRSQGCGLYSFIVLR